VLEHRVDLQGRAMIAAAGPRTCEARCDAVPPAAGAPTKITAITADEAIEVGGDGHTTDYDIAIIDDVTFDLRSERQGGSDGRVYRVHYLDDAGNAGSCEFLVPHDRGPVNGAVHSGIQVAVTR
jgi:hypothetical protein